MEVCSSCRARKNSLQLNPVYFQLQIDTCWLRGIHAYQS